MTGRINRITFSNWSARSMTPHRFNICSMKAIPKTMPPLVRMVGSSKASGLNGTKEYALKGRGLLRDDLGDGEKIFRKGNLCVFLMLIPTFALFIFSPLIYALFQLTAFGRPLRLLGSAPLQVPQRASRGVYSLC